MGRFNVLLALIFCLIIAVFALANNQPMEINYLYGSVELSAVLVILGSAALGALAIFIFGLFKNIQVRLKLRSLRHEIKNLLEKLQIAEKERDTFLAQVGRLQEASAAFKQVNHADYKEAGVTMTDEGNLPLSGKTAGQGGAQGDNQQQAEEERER
jgi:putative membrane protein